MEVQVAHAIPGRIRLKVPEIRSDPEAAVEIQRRVSVLKELRDVEVHAASGSVVLHYELTAEDGVLGKLETLFDGFEKPQQAEHASTSNGEAAAAIAGMFQRADKRVEKTTGLGLKLLVPLLLAASAALMLIGYMLRRKRLPLPSWYELLWFAFNTFIILDLELAEHDKEAKS